MFLFERNVSYTFVLEKNVYFLEMFWCRINIFVFVYTILLHKNVKQLQIKMKFQN